MNVTTSSNVAAAKCIGIDLHSNNAVICVKTTEFTPGKGMYSKTLATKTVSVVGGADKVMEFLRPFCEGQDHIAVVESTYNWYFLADAFEERGWTLNIADPSTVSQANIKASDDKTDASYLAERLCSNSLKRYVPQSKHDRALRDLCRQRMDLVQKRAEFKITLVNLYSNQLGKRISADSLFKRAYANGIENHKVDPDLFPEFDDLAVRMRVALMLENISLLNNQIYELDAYIQPRCKQLELAKVCQTMPGCGPVLSSVIATEIGNIKRFKTAGDFMSYCRLCPTSKLSNGKSKGLGNAKNGNAYLSWAMTEVANISLRSNKVAQKVFDRLLNKAGGLRVKAIRTLAAKYARGLHRALTKGEPFDIEYCLCGVRSRAGK